MKRYIVRKRRVFIDIGHAGDGVRWCLSVGHAGDGVRWCLSVGHAGDGVRWCLSVNGGTVWHVCSSWQDAIERLNRFRR